MNKDSDEDIRETIYYLEELRNKARGYAVTWLDIAIDAVRQYREEQYSNEC